MVLTERQHAAASDFDLLRAPPGDVDAFAEVVRRHQDFVFGAVLRIVKDRSTAEDLAQETFLRAYRGRARFRGDAAVRTWLYRIAVNLALNVVTRRREYPTDRLPDGSTATPGPEKEVEAAELRARLRVVIAGLADELRLPLLMREDGELSYQEIADATGLPLNTVRTRIFRARRMVRSEVAAWR